MKQVAFGQKSSFTGGCRGSLLLIGGRGVRGGGKKSLESQDRIDGD